MTNQSTQTTAQEVATASPMLPSAEIELRAQRDKTIKRFNGLFVYVPVALMFVLFALVMLVLFMATIIDGDALQQSYSSGFADIILLMTCILPATIVAAIFPTASLFLLYKRRQHGSFVRAPLTKGLRKVDDIIVTADDKAGAAQEQVANRIIDVRGRIAYAATVFVRMQEFVTEKLDQFIKRN